MEKEISYGNIWRIAYPIIIGSFSQTILNITDTIFVGRLGELQLASGALAVLIYLTLIMVVNGFTVGNQIIMARRFGEGELAAIGKTFTNAALILAIFVAVGFILVKDALPHIIHYIISNPDIAEQVDHFSQVRIWGIAFAAFTLLLRGFYVATANTKVIIAVTGTTVTLNIALNYILIFGKMGAPAMGFTGAALASVISEAVGLAIIIANTIRFGHFKSYLLLRANQLSRKVMLSILKVASPMMLQHLISFSAWFLVFLFIERMGERSLAISNIVRTIYITMMVPIWGFAEATNSLVSFLMGEKHFEKITVLIKRSMVLSFSGVLLMVIGAYAFLPQVVGFYTSDASLIIETIPVVKVVMIGSLTMSIGFIAFMAISGTGNTLTAFALELSDILLYAILAYLLATCFRVNVTGIWFIETFYSCYMIVACLLYLRFGKWRAKKI